MGLLDSVLGSVLGGGQPSSSPASAQAPAAGMSPLAKAVLLLLAAKAWQHYRDQRASSGSANAGPAPAPPPSANGGLGGLGGLLGGSLGGLIGSLGGAGALGGLLNQLQQKGLGPQTQSWIGPGQNKPIAPHQLEHALGNDTLDELSRQFNMPRAQLMTELSAELPQAVDQVTPDGRLPSDAELSKL